MKKLKFYKETSGRWYVDLPEWTGDKSALEMVCGADTMLDIIADGKGEAWLYLSEESFENADVLIFNRMAIDIGEGAYYDLEKYQGVEMKMFIWLCDVAKFVFGKFPKKIYLKSASTD